MPKNSVKKVDSLLKKEKVKAILKCWDDNTQEWIQSCDLRRELVKKYEKKWIQSKDKTYFFNEKTKKERREKPEFLYKNDSGFYRDLRDMKICGILDNKKVLQQKGGDKSYYRPSKKFRLEPIKLHYASLIKKTREDRVYPFLDGLLFLPENLNVKEFQKGELVEEDPEREIDEDGVSRVFLFEKAVSQFLSSIKLILLEAKSDKAKRLWMKMINDNRDIYPPLKLYLSVELSISLMIKCSPLYFYWAVDEGNVEELDWLESRYENLFQLIYLDITRSLNFHPKNWEEINNKIQDNFRQNQKYINKIWKKIHEILREKEFGVLVSPTAFLKHPSKFSKGLEWLLNEKEEVGLLKVQRLGKGGTIKRATEEDLMEKHHSSFFEFHPIEIEEIGIDIGKEWFDRFSKPTQGELTNFCSDLGYPENDVFRVLGLFMFPLPFLT